MRRDFEEHRSSGGPSGVSPARPRIRNLPVTPLGRQHLARIRAQQIREPITDVIRMNDIAFKVNCFPRRPERIEPRRIVSLADFEDANPVFLYQRGAGRSREGLLRDQAKRRDHTPGKCRKWPRYSLRRSDRPRRPPQGRRKWPLILPINSQSKTKANKIRHFYPYYYSLS